jgi:hypothetical protein
VPTSTRQHLAVAAAGFSTAIALLAATATPAGGAPAAQVTNTSTAKAGKSAAKAPAWSPRTGAVFNNPRGTRAQQLAIITQIDRSIDAAPRGATIRAATYRFDMSSTATKLVAAHRRGVNVRFLVDDSFVTPQVRTLRKALGTNRKSRSFLATCRHSCMSNVGSVMHAKFFLFSTSGRAKRVSMVSSANVYSDNTFTSWNNLHTVVGDNRLYASLSRYHADMVTDQNRPNYYRMTASGKYKLYLFPRAKKAGTNTVLHLDVLNNVSCTTGAGYGRGGRTVIRVGMWGWSGPRTAIAQRLWQLHNAGCHVEVILNSGKTSPKVIAALLRRSPRHGQMLVHDAWYDKDRNRRAELYIHHKALTIDGRWFGRNAKIVYTGSQNFNEPAIRSNNELVLRIRDRATLQAYSRNLNLIRDRYSKRLTRLP